MNTLSSIQEEVSTVLEAPERRDLSPYNSRTKVKKLSPKGYNTCVLYMRGYSVSQIAALVGWSEQECRVVLSSQTGKDELQRLKGILDEDFKALQGKVNEVLRESLNHVDSKIALSGASLWAKMSGIGNDTTSITINNQVVNLDKYRKV